MSKKYQGNEEYEEYEMFSGGEDMKGHYVGWHSGDRLLWISSQKY